MHVRCVRYASASTNCVSHSHSLERLSCAPQVSVVTCALCLEAVEPVNPFGACKCLVPARRSRTRRPSAACAPSTVQSGGGLGCVRDRRGRALPSVRTRGIVNICDVSVSGQPHAHRAASGAEDGNWSCAERIQGSALKTIRGCRRPSSAARRGCATPRARRRCCPPRAPPPP